MSDERLKRKTIRFWIFIIAVMPIILVSLNLLAFFYVSSVAEEHVLLSETTLDTKK